MRHPVLILFGIAMFPGAAVCAPIILPSFVSIALNDSRMPATWHPDRYTPAGFENVGGIFGMASTASVNPMIGDYARARRFHDVFQYYQRPGVASYGYPGLDEVPAGLYAWLYLPDLQRGGLVRRFGAVRLLYPGRAHHARRHRRHRHCAARVSPGPHLVVRRRFRRGCGRCRPLSAPDRALRRRPRIRAGLRPARAPARRAAPA